jgi:hypothetical protein
MNPPGARERRAVEIKPLNWQRNPLRGGMARRLLRS